MIRRNLKLLFLVLIIAKRKILDYRILNIPFDWNKYNQQSIINLSSVQKEEIDPEVKKHLNVIKNGEGKKVEFKSTLCYDIRGKTKEGAY